MILCDTGIIVAAIHQDDTYHRRAVGTLIDIRESLVTSWPCMTEAMYLLGRVGPHAQEVLRRQIEAGLFTLVEPSRGDILRMCALMRRYADAPMDFADASLVVAAETLGITRILTLDRHFYAYRIHDKAQFEVSP